MEAERVKRSQNTSEKEQGAGTVPVRCWAPCEAEVTHTRSSMQDGETDARAGTEAQEAGPLPSGIVVCGTVGVHPGQP